MPTIRIEMFEGRTPEQKRALVAAVTEACVKTIGASPESVDILLFDIAKQNWATGGTLWSDKAAKPPTG
ncbi:4-oxalocrotonate tautomerase [Rhizobacter sp. Root404]|jgi:4-oxalocrotonate tautomerase|uniref:4-oxalocrotonate tautomerase n=1 Tax=Rhizobacter sp. Root404 TaxID=1736528 RepID=UPI0006F23571|nr:4-oxalocrotonate tautomerase [Rhizobacter sp. Root404]KQW38168.1 4-oxalocrotonate tautomerase [Rhizobacter sp. Root404]